MGDNQLRSFGYSLAESIGVEAATIAEDKVGFEVTNGPSMDLGGIFENMTQEQAAFQPAQDQLGCRGPGFCIRN